VLGGPERAATEAQQRWPEANLLAGLHHAKVPLGEVVVEGHMSVLEETRDLHVALVKADERVEGLAPFHGPACLRVAEADRG